VVIDPAWYTPEPGSKKDIEANFICSICHTLVVDPQECEKCEKVYCGKCIKQWTWTKKQELLKHGTLVGNSSLDKAFKANCPTCKQLFSGRPLHRYARSHLEEFKFKCGHCKSSESIPYEKFIQHL